MDTGTETPSEKTVGISFMIQFLLSNLNTKNPPVGSLRLIAEGQEIDLDLEKMDKAMVGEKFNQCFQGVAKDVTELTVSVGVGRELTANELSALEALEKEPLDEEETYNPNEAVEQRFLFRDLSDFPVVLHGLIAVNIIGVTKDHLECKQRNLAGVSAFYPGQAVVKDEVVLFFVRELDMSNEEDVELADDYLYEEE